MEVIKNLFKFISDLKAIYNGIKEIKRTKGLPKGKKTTTPHIQKYFEILKKKPPKTIKALNISSTSRKPSGKNLIEFSLEAFSLVSPILSTAPVKKLNLTTLETTLKSSLSSPGSLTSTISNTSSLNIITAKGKMIMRP